MSQATTSQEYKALLLAQRALSLALEPRPNEDGQMVYPEPRDVAMVASALTRVVDQKRVMRGQPAPKPADVSLTKRSRKRSPDDHWEEPGPASPPKPS